MGQAGVTLKGMNMARRNKLIFLAMGSVAFGCLCFFIARPYLNSILAAAILAVVCYPLFRRLEQFTGSSNRAAALSVLILFVTLVGPAILLLILLRGEISNVIQWLNQNTAVQNGWSVAFATWTDNALSWIAGHAGVHGESIKAALISRANAAGEFLVKKTAHAFSGLTSGIIDFFIVAFTLFFLLRDGAWLVRQTKRILPLTDQEASALFNKIDESVRANVLGVLAVGSVQGALAGLAFWVLGVPSPILWSILTGICSAVPIFGSSIVWAPAAIYLFLTHSWVKALILIGWSVGIVSLSDNIVRPWVLSDRVNLSPALVIFALLGGIEMFGPIGIFVGPVILSLALAFFSMFFEEIREREFTAGPAGPLVAEKPGE
jgi:predicted PurR-regulated permease PerM